MFALVRAMLGRLISTKVGIALIAALVVGGGGTAMALATTHGQLPSASQVAQSTATHSDGGSGATKTPGATKTSGDADQDDQECTGTPSATRTSDDGSDGGSHATGTPSATRTSGDADQDETECGKSTGTRTPEPTERPQQTRTPGPTPTGRPGGD